MSHAPAHTVPCNISNLAAAPAQQSASLSGRPLSPLYAAVTMPAFQLLDRVVTGGKVLLPPLRDTWYRAADAARNVGRNLVNHEGGLLREARELQRAGQEVPAYLQAAVQRVSCRCVIPALAAPFPDA
jgi:hypothetical protein